MKGFLCAFALAITILAASAAEQSAELKLYCLSVVVLPATDTQFGLEYKMSITSAGEFEPANNEISPAPEDVPYSHQGVFLYEDLFEVIPMPFYMSLPPPDDNDNNDIPDFLEVEHAASGLTSGESQDYNGPWGRFTANWSRAAGEVLGTVVMDFPELGLTFAHTFVLLQYNGTYTYEKAANKVAGTVSLSRVDNPPDTLNGSWNMTVNAGNLALAPATWTDGLGIQVEIDTSGTMTKSGLQFSDFIMMNDGFTTTSALDYNFWHVLLKPADANGNSIPDIVESDDQPVERPELAIIKRPGEVEIQATGTAGQAYILQRASVIPVAPGDWTDVQNVTIGANPTTVIIPLDTNQNAFFRLKQ